MKKIFLITTLITGTLTLTGCCMRGAIGGCGCGCDGYCSSHIIQGNKNIHNKTTIKSSLKNNTKSELS